MKIHDKIYLQLFDDEGHINEEATWCEDQINDSDVEYVRSGAVEHRLAADDGYALANRVRSEIDNARKWLLNLSDDDEPISQELVATYLNLIEKALVPPITAKAIR